MIDCLCTKSWTELWTLLIQEIITDLFLLVHVLTIILLLVFFLSSCGSSTMLILFFYWRFIWSKQNVCLVYYISETKKYFTVIGSVQVNLSFIYYTALQCTGLIQTYSVFYQSHVDLPTLVKGNQDTHGKKNRNI